MEKTCETCVNWKSKFGYSRVGGIPSLTKDQGICDMCSEGTDPESILSISHGGEGEYDAALITRKDFACILWASKAPKEGS